MSAKIKVTAREMLDILSGELTDAAFDFLKEGANDQFVRGIAWTVMVLENVLREVKE